MKVVGLLFLTLLCAFEVSAYTPPLELRSEGLVTCDICKAFAELLEFGFALNRTEESLLNDATDLCLKLLPQFNLAFCQGAVRDRFGPVMYRVIEKVGGKLPDICDYVGACKPSSLKGHSGVHKKSRAKSRHSAVTVGPPTRWIVSNESFNLLLKCI